MAAAIAAPQQIMRGKLAAQLAGHSPRAVIDRDIGPRIFSNSGRANG